MCTLTWRSEEHLEVFFNRDELKTRSRADPPRRFQASDGTNYLSPRDPDGGGTWMLANEHGVVVCLLNRWHQETASPARKSRGLLVQELASLRSPDEVGELLQSLSAGAKPFDLIALSGPSGKQGALTWDGEQVTERAIHLPLTSSSFQFEKVKAAREQSYQQAPTLEEFQGNPHEVPSAFTVRMNRPDAQTWSRSALRVGEDELSWHYWEEFADLKQEPQLHTASLPLRK